MLYSQDQSFQTSKQKPPSDLHPATTSNGTRKDGAIHPVVYIIDDDEAIREALMMLIESTGWQAMAFDSAAGFLGACPQAENCCLILDLQMPGMSGADLLERLRVEGRDIPVIVITAFPENSMARRAQTAGARTILTKPFNDSQLLAELHKVLDDNIQ